VTRDNSIQFNCLFYVQHQQLKGQLQTTTTTTTIIIIIIIITAQWKTAFTD
jgi:hypothetical protein